MWIFGRKRVGRVPSADAPVGPPENVIELIYALSENWGRAIRAIAIISFSCIGIFVAAAIGVDIILVATRGLKGLRLSNVIAPALFVGNWLLFLIASSAKKRITNWRARTKDARKQLDNSGPGQSRAQGREQRKRQR
jgi:hypothetical protein